LKLEKVYKEHELKFVIDSAFSTMNHDFLIVSSQEDLTTDAEFDNINDQIANIVVKREATSMCQSAKWGMRAVQTSFPRLKDQLVYEENGEQRIMFDCLFLLFNLRSHLVGTNQVTSVYLPSLDIDANIEFVLNSMSCVLILMSLILL